ncbi:hypothetical protein CVT24_002778 [Panaeolus cyanescens]|uniref:Uncharacterized protein n=1 Tax=Panaeolus cyanescens TaxID=181874 RepID=A0A409VNG7_9AGAR|nr:hypothetical protein CVT24_002778 [Panaeolus cyanescens]
MEFRPPVLFVGVVGAVIFFVVLPLLIFRRMSKRDALIAQAARRDLEANRRSAQRSSVKRSETVLTLPTYKRDIDQQEELFKFKAEIERIEAEPDTPANRTLLAQLKAEVERLNNSPTRGPYSSSPSTTILSPLPTTTLPPPAYIPLDKVRTGSS